MNKIFNKKKESKTISKFRDQQDKLITFEELSQIPLNEMIQIVPDLPTAIECTRISSNSDSLMFTVTMKKNQLWEKHHHDCQENIVIFKGKLVDTISQTEATKAEIMNFKPFQRHYIIAEEDSIFYVEFKKPITK